MATYGGVWDGWVYPDPSMDLVSQFEFEQEQLEQLSARSRVLPSCKIIGGVVRFAVADSYAIYLITREKPLTLCQLPIGSGWHIPDAHMRGLNKEDIVSLLAKERAIHKFLSRRK